MKASLVIIHPNQEKEVFVFSAGQSEEMVKCYNKKKKQHPKSNFYTVNRSKATAPTGTIEITRSLLWCPYCRSVRRFVEGKFEGVHQCRVCGISQNDYYVKFYNFIGE